MILPIVAYGDPVLRKKATQISSDYPGLDELIENMFESIRTPLIKKNNLPILYIPLIHPL